MAFLCAEHRGSIIKPGSDDAKDCLANRAPSVNVVLTFRVFIRVGCPLHLRQDYTLRLPRCQTRTLARTL